MQNLLLGEMFRQQIPAIPQDTSNPYPHITLDTFRSASAFYLERQDQEATLERQASSLAKQLSGRQPISTSTSTEPT